MTTLRLYRHGEHPEQQITDELPATPAQPKNSANFSGVAKRFDKHTRAHENGMSMGWVKRTYADAFECTRAGDGVRGLLFFWGCVGFFGFGSIGVLTVSDFLRTDGVFDVVLLVAFVALFVGMSIIFPLWCIRLELFAPEDLPVIFDRKHRKVYQITRYTQPGLKGLFRPWPAVALEYDWDLVDAQLNVQTAVGPGIAKRQHSLWFIVRRSVDDDTPIDAFTLGNPFALNEGLASAFYEHIRRFMEEGGRHVVRGEPLAKVLRPKTVREGIAQVSPLRGRSFFRWVREEPFYAFVLAVASPAYLIMLPLWGIGNYLAYKTSMPVQWPLEVRDAVGEPLT
ncbi:DUF6708 domain-containing protein [Denitromonas halophila]|uniref:DUF6708 domain-containing protein n=1 Tax=Denitromonas halophila TaxID=1629404 RepID=A0A557R0X7_9RHOO|nr:DUF6708 domain-containing protein [Denitromonas halophila]TVO58817.1 hypothetical protein FHP91_03900 [Denitromonas halophila]